MDLQFVGARSAPLQLFGCRKVGSGVKHTWAVPRGLLGLPWWDPELPWPLDPSGSEEEPQG